MGVRDVKREERFISDWYEPFNILAVSQDNEHVTLSAEDFEKLLACRDIVLVALHSKRDVPYSLVKKVSSSFIASDY
jgi:hypothetical protein